MSIDQFTTSGGRIRDLYLSLLKQHPSPSDDVTAGLSEDASIRNLALDLAPPDASSKDVVTAMSLKEEGNRLFKERLFPQALHAYTNSLLHFPADTKDPQLLTDLSIIYANRSAALDALMLYSGVVQDADAALKLGYPRNLQFKVFSRRGQALLKLRQFKSAKESYKKCLDMIGKSDLPSKERDAFRARTTKHMNVFNCTKENLDQFWPTEVTVQLSQGESAQLPACSSLIQLDPSSGSFSASSPVPSESVLLCERPLAAIVLPPAADRPWPRFCPVSLQPMMAPVPCKLGVNDLFSNEQARDVAMSTFQPHEWRVGVALEGAGLSPLGRLALRMITTVPKEQACKGLSGIEDPVTRQAFELETDSDSDLSKEEKLTTRFVAAVLLNALRKSDYFAGLKDADLREAEKNVEVLLKRAAIVVGRNARTVKALRLPGNLGEAIANLDRGQEFPAVDVAVALYPSYARLAKMSPKGAQSDTLSYYLGGKLVLQSAFDLPANRRLSVSGPVSSSESAGDDVIAFRCSNRECNGSFPLSSATREIVVKCPMNDCGKDTNIRLKLTKMDELKKQHEEIRKLFAKDKLEEAEKALKSLYSEWSAIALRPCREMCRIERELHFCTLYHRARQEKRLVTPTA